MLQVNPYLQAFSGEGNLHMSRDTGMCHYFGYFLGVAPGFLGTFLGYSRIFRYSRNFGYHSWLFPEFWVSFLVKFDFFQNNPDFGVLILKFPSTTSWNVACRALVSMILQSVSWILAEFCYNRSPQGPYTGTCTILQETINGFLCPLIVFVKCKHYH